MADPVLRPLKESVEGFIEEIPHPRKQEEAHQLVELFRETTSFEPVVWGGGMIGFGQYRYRYDSGREGEAPLAAFATRKTRHTIYLEAKFPEREDLLARIGKHKSSLVCVHVNKLADIDLVVLRELIAASTKETIRKNEIGNGKV